MFTAWDNVRTLSLEVVKTGTMASEFMLLAVVETITCRGCILLPCIPAPWRCLETVRYSRTTDGRKMLFSLQYPRLVHTKPGNWSGYCWLELHLCVIPTNPSTLEGAADLPCWITFNLSCCHVLSDHYCWLYNNLSPYCWWSTVWLLCTSKYWILTVLWFKCYCYFMEALNSSYSLGLLYSVIVATTVLLLLRICSTITDTIE